MADSSRGQGSPADGGSAAADAPSATPASDPAPPDWQAIVDAVTLSLSVFDADNRLIAWNRAFASPGGIAPVEFQAGMTLLQVLEAFAARGRYGPGDPQEIARSRLAEITRLRASGQSEEFINADGSVVIRNRYRTGNGDTIVVAHNVDRQLRIEQELARTLAILRATFEAVDQPVCVWDQDKRLVAWNDKYLEMNGLLPDEVYQGMPSMEILLATALHGQLGDGDPEERARARFQQIWGSGLKRRDTVQRPGGHTYDVHRGPLPDGGVVSIFNDVTERERTAEELRRAKAQAESANAVKSDFLANMSHELRTPLNAIMGFAEMMMMSRIDDPARYREYAGDIRNSAGLLLGIINDLLDLSRIEAGKTEFRLVNLDLRAVVETNLNLIRRTEGAANLSIRNEVPPGFPEVQLDESFLNQALLNLLSNAVKATPDGGSIAVAAALTGENRFRLSVADTGIGMSAEVLRTVFNPYDVSGNSYVRKEKGTGLGLSIVKRLVEMLRGEVTVESAPGAGTTVRLDLPVRFSS